MELILKLPPGKFPFIGILFNREYEASKLNQEQVQVNNLYYYKIIIETKGDKLDLTLKNEDWIFTYKYENLTYNPDSLKRFLFNSMGSEVINFGHIVKKNDEHILVKTLSTHSYYVLKVKELKFLQEEHL